jgi:alpha-maltose-1-phosphate synthase
MVGLVDAPDIVHCHTWYSHLAGCLAAPLTGARLVLTTHSLEPHRPWKAEQLGTAYNATVWIEGTAYGNADGVIAVSQSMKEDVQSLYGVEPDRVRVIHNGIDPDEYRPVDAPAVLRRLDIDPAVPFVLFVGRITRQKGILHLVRAIRHLDAGIQVVLCAGAPDTEAIGHEMAALVADAKRDSAARITWIPEMLPKQDIIALYSHAAVFVCPSVYEPFGIINLEAMSCETPVVASAVGGIPEIVVPGETGLLVPFEAVGGGSPEPADPDAFTAGLASAINGLMGNPDRRRAMGVASRERVLAQFSWQRVAEQTRVSTANCWSGRPAQPAARSNRAARASRQPRSARSRRSSAATRQSASSMAFLLVAATGSRRGAQTAPPSAASSPTRSTPALLVTDSTSLRNSGENALRRVSQYAFTPGLMT